MQNQRDSLSLNSIFGMMTLTVAFMSLFVGCSSAPKKLKIAQMTVKEAYESQKPIKIRNSRADGRPEWTKKTVYEKDGNIYFSGGFLNGSDYSVTVRCANAEALKVVTQSISEFIRAEFSEYVKGSNAGTDGVDRYVGDGIASFSDNLHLQGIRQTEIYYEEIFNPAVNRLMFNIWVRLEMTNVDYMKAKVDVLRNLRAKFSKTGKVEAKEKAERLLEQLKKKVEKEADYGA